MSVSYDFGKAAELHVAQKYLNKEYEILAKNYRFKKAEIDIIAKKGNTLIIVEVKARSSSHLLKPEDAVNKKKKRLLIDAANHFIQSKDLDVEVRFDVVSVLKSKEGLKCNFIVDAFKAHEI